MPVHLRLTGDVLTYAFRSEYAQKSVPSPRGVVSAFTERSASRMSRYLRSCEARYRVLVTLTYPGETQRDGASGWGRSKEHLKAFGLRCQRALPPGERDSFSLFWVLEWQARGVPHFHLFCTHEFLAGWVADAWYHVVGSGDIRHFRAGTRVERIRGERNDCIRYARKYAAKRDQKKLPNVFENQEGFGRWWGVVGSRKVVVAATVFRQGSLSVPPLNDLWKELTDLCRNAVRQGLARRFTNPHCILIWFKNRVTEEKCRAIMRQIIYEQLRAANAAEVLPEAEPFQT